VREAVKENTPIQHPHPTRRGVAPIFGKDNDPITPNHASMTACRTRTGRRKATVNDLMTSILEAEKQARIEYRG
jgi:hypothetical protein